MALKMHNETKPKTTASRSWAKGGIPTTKASAKPKAAEPRDDAAEDTGPGSPAPTTAPKPKPSRG